MCVGGYGIVRLLCSLADSSIDVFIAECELVGLEDVVTG